MTCPSMNQKYISIVPNQTNIYNDDMCILDHCKDQRTHDQRGNFNDQLPANENQGIGELLPHNHQKSEHRRSRNGLRH